MGTLLFGHRGASREAPENTLASFALAFEEGADGIEADFQLSADGEILCLHDPSTGRTAGVDLPVKESAASLLRTLDVGRWKGERFRGERIPTLAEVLDLVPSGKMLCIELKSGPAILPPLARTLAASRRTTDEIRILAFDGETIRLAKELLPSFRAVWLTSYRFRGVWRPGTEEVIATARRIGADGVASQARPVVEERFVASLKALGLELHLWTVDRVAEARRLRALGVDSIMTNRPAFLRRAFGEY